MFTTFLMFATSITFADFITFATVVTFAAAVTFVTVVMLTTIVVCASVIVFATVSLYITSMCLRGIVIFKEVVRVVLGPRLVTRCSNPTPLRGTVFRKSRSLAEPVVI